MSRVQKNTRDKENMVWEINFLISERMQTWEWEVVGKSDTK